MLSSHSNDIITKAEDILWKRLPSNAHILASLEARNLKNEKSLPEMTFLLNLLGHKASDLDGLRVVHITGSKGKGSTAAFVESILRSHGLKTALYTSPHLVHPRERLRINGQLHDLFQFSENVVNTFESLQRYGCLPGFFRFMTLMSFAWMLRLKERGLLDVAIVEVGMGGRYDSTNIVERPFVTAITSISMEHQKQLGPSLADIACHKAGIAKASCPLITIPQDDQVMKVIYEEAEIRGAPVSVVESLELQDISDLNLGIEGEHQRLNASLAVRICQKWWEKYNPGSSLYPNIIKSALQSTRWPGRHQIHRDDDGRIWYLDGAHTIDSIQFAANWYSKHTCTAGSGTERVLLFHCTHERPYENLLKPLLDLNKRMPFDRVYFVKPEAPTDSIMEMENPDLSLHVQMADYWNKVTVSTIASPLAIKDLSGILPKINNMQLLVTGSLYLVGDTMRTLNIPL